MKILSADDWITWLFSDYVFGAQMSHIIKVSKNKYRTPCKFYLNLGCNFLLAHWSGWTGSGSLGPWTFLLEWFSILSLRWERIQYPSALPSQDYEQPFISSVLWFMARSCKLCFTHVKKKKKVDLDLIACRRPGAHLMMLWNPVNCQTREESVILCMRICC